MTVNITYFVHGTTIDNEKSIATGWNPGELSPLGIKRAKQLGELVKNEEYDIVFTSDLKRAIESARYSFGDKFHKQPTNALREINYGNHTGQSTSKIFICEHTTIRFPDGESYRDVQNRMEDFLLFLEQNYSGRNIAMVSHQAPQLALEVIANGKSWQEALDTDWRKTGNWQPGWKYVI